jgi:hypothetical protein
MPGARLVLPSPNRLPRTCLDPALAGAGTGDVHAAAPSIRTLVRRRVRCRPRSGGDSGRGGCRGPDASSRRRISSLAAPVRTAIAEANAAEAWPTPGRRLADADADADADTCAPAALLAPAPAATAPTRAERARVHPG